MQVSVEKVTDVERRLTIVVPANQVEEAYAKQIDRFAKNANIKGFRPGKAPLSYIQQRFGEDARREALNDVIQKAFYDAITEKQLRPVSAPRIEPKTMLADQPLEFTASFEVLPEIETIKFAVDNIEKLNVDIKDEDINAVTEQLLKQHTKWRHVDRAAKEKDRVVITYDAAFEGKPESDQKVENYSLELGSKMMFPGFEEGLIGAKAGDTKVLSLKFPEDFGMKDKAGQPIEFNVEVKEVFEAEMPAIDEDFVKKLGIKSGKVEEFKDQIVQSLKHERDRIVKEKMKEQIFRQLLEQNPIAVPASLIANEAKNIHDEVYPQHQHHDHHQHSDDELSAFNDIARKRVVLGLLIAEYAKQQSLQADKDRVKKRMEEIASVYENPKEVIAWLSDDERRSGIEAQVLEDQVMDKLIEGIPVTEKTLSYGELKGACS